MRIRPYPFINLPDEKIWKNRLENGSKAGPDFDGWAIYEDDPLWIKSPSPKSTDIIISRILFRKYFDYETYRNILKNELPDEFLKNIPEKIDKNRKNPLSIIWMRGMRVTNGFRKELFPCNVRWVDRFPVIDKIAFVFPLSTYHALQAAHNFPELRYFMESNGKGGERIKQILIEADPENKIIPDTLKFYNNLALKMGNGEAREFRGDILITLKYPTRKSWINAYTAQHNITYDIMETVIGDNIREEKGKLILPCNRLPNEYLLNKSCTDDKIQPVHLDVTEKGNGFYQTLVYVPDRTLLSIAVDNLLKIKKQFSFYSSVLSGCIKQIQFS
ncbi:MAG: hypothetical protein GY795_29755 [Desulfobacterales bacterium]|nr:hypothetical protein [Desulfobacterales bacterium]